MTMVTLNTIDLCGWLVRFSLYLLVSFVASALILPTDVPVHKVEVASVFAALLAPAVVLDAYLRHRPLWLYPFATRGQRIHISAVQTVIVALWFAGCFAFLWWFLPFA